MKMKKKKQENNVQNSMFDDIKSQNYKNDLISKKNDNRIYQQYIEESGIERFEPEMETEKKENTRILW